MQRGEVHLVDLEPIRGAESNKFRPAVIVSNDGANAAADRYGRGVVTVVPLTSNVARVYSFQMVVPAGIAGLSVDSKAQAEQVRAIDVTRVRRRLGVLPPDLLRELDDALRLHLSL